jgi:hypothetical protein
MVSLGYTELATPGTPQAALIETSFKTTPATVRDPRPRRQAPVIADQLRNTTGDVQVIPPVHQTFGVILKRQPVQFVFSVDPPEWSVYLAVAEKQTEWLRNALKSIALGEENVALKHIALGTTETKTNKEKLERLSDELDQLDLSKLPDIILVALLRNTYSFRAHVTSWQRLLDKTEQVLQSRGQPTRSLLRGLRT